MIGTRNSHSHFEPSLRQVGLSHLRCRHAARTLNAYIEHYHTERNHQGKDNVLLFPRASRVHPQGPVQCRERLGGLLRYYHQEAA